MYGTGDACMDVKKTELHEETQEKGQKDLRNRLNSQALIRAQINAKQKQPGCKKSARPIRSHNDYKRPKTLISSKAKKLNILLRILLLE